jgi:hypothetical protein
MMKFDLLCEYVLNEADRDYISGKANIFSLADDASEKVTALELNDVKELIKKTTLPFTAEYLVGLVNGDLTDYMPAETPDFKKLLKRSIWDTYDDTEKKSERAAGVLFAFLKKKKIAVTGIPKKDIASDDDIEKLANELEGDFFDNDVANGLSMSQVSKFGGSIPSSDAFEDESRY